jgi:hypothetical protein
MASLDGISLAVGAATMPNAHHVQHCPSLQNAVLEAGSAGKSGAAFARGWQGERLASLADDGGDEGEELAANEADAAERSRAAGTSGEERADRPLSSEGKRIIGTLMDGLQADFISLVGGGGGALFGCWHSGQTPWPGQCANGLAAWSLL